MRRILLSLISLILLFTFTSCSGNRNNELTPEEYYLQTQEDASLKLTR